jgi:hypothetical protein
MSWLADPGVLKLGRPGACGEGASGTGAAARGVTGVGAAGIGNAGDGTGGVGCIADGCGGATGVVKRFASIVRSFDRVPLSIFGGAATAGCGSTGAFNCTIACCCSASVGLISCGECHKYFGP